MLPAALLWRHSSSSVLRGMKNSPVLPLWSFCIYRESQETERENKKRTLVSATPHRRCVFRKRNRFQAPLRCPFSDGNLLLQDVHRSSEARREIVRRMEALMAMPRVTRKHASHVGGLEPSINETAGWSDMPRAYDAGNTVYAAAYDLILDDVGIKEVHYLREYNNETKGDVIEALLGAAMVTATEKLEHDIVYSDLVGGTTPRGDMATRVLIETIDDTIAWLDESFERDPWISSRWTPFAVV